MLRVMPHALMSRSAGARRTTQKELLGPLSASDRRVGRSQKDSPTKFRPVLTGLSSAAPFADGDVPGSPGGSLETHHRCSRQSRTSASQRPSIPPSCFHGRAGLRRCCAGTLRRQNRGRDGWCPVTRRLSVCQNAFFAEIQKPKPGRTRLSRESSTCSASMRRTVSESQSRSPSSERQ